MTTPAPEQVSRILTAAGREGGERAAEELLPILYEELRSLARSRLARERGSQTLQATALVHEAYLRLVGSEDPGWRGRAHFFGAAAEAMRRVLVDRARAKGRAKRGGGAQRVTLDESAIVSAEPPDDLLALDAALGRLEKHDPRKAQVVKLRHFAGLSLEDTAAALDVSLSTVKADWTYARAWLHREISDLERDGAADAP